MSNVTPAIISGVVTLAVAVVGIIAAAWRQSKQFASDLSTAQTKLQSELKLQGDRLQGELKLQGDRLQGELKIQEERLKVELRTEFMAETAIRQLLSHPRWDQRKFNTIKGKMGDAFEDAELRKLLVRSGAVCFWLTLKSGEKEELWGLIERNQGRLSE
jgi:hypothetical protein